MEIGEGVSVEEASDVWQFPGTFGDPWSLHREYEGSNLGPNRESLGGRHEGEDVHECFW